MISHELREAILKVIRVRLSPIRGAEMNNEILDIHYEFAFPNDTTRKMVIRLDKKNLSLINDTEQEKLAWTRLDFKQCKCCPLDSTETPDCPIAVNLAHLVDDFSETLSFDKCHVTCTTTERTYVKHASVQEGLYSVFGLIMATSGCPVMDFFRPLARFHLPFSTIDETKMRVTSIYFLREYFQHRKGESPDFSLKSLDDFYEKVQLVNRGVMNRISAVTTKDAGVNAMAVLFAISKMLSMEIEHDLGSLQNLFVHEAG